MECNNKTQLPTHIFIEIQQQQGTQHIMHNSLNHPKQHTIGSHTKHVTHNAKYATD